METLTPAVDEKKTTYRGVDLAKLLLAVCVVGIHTNIATLLPGIYERILTAGLFRLAVPYFFVASGFFMYRKVEKLGRERAWQVVSGYILRLMKPFLLFTVINSVQKGIDLLRGGTNWKYAALNVFKSAVFSPYGALWFVLACIVGALLLFPFLRWGRVWPAVIIGICLYFFAVLCNNYYFIAENTPLQSLVELYRRVFITSRNGLLVGFLFLALGCFACQISQILLRRRALLITVTAVLYAVYVAEFLTLYLCDCSYLDDRALYLTYIPMIPALFLVTLLIDPPIPHKLSMLFRDLSVGIYYLHCPLRWFVLLVTTNPLINYPVVLTAAVGICLLAYSVKRKPKWISGLLK